jgi:serine/threonine-protein kinase HipA
MSDRMLHVFMDGTHIGMLHMTGAGALSFIYDDGYSSADGATPLSLSMPLRQRTHGNRVVNPFLQGLLPDNVMALSSMANRYQVSANSPFALLEHVGHDVAGALQIIPPHEVSEDAHANRTAMTPLDDDRLGAMLRNAIAVYDDGVAMQNTQRMSLAGAQAKLGVAKMPGGGWAIPERGTPTTHIFKPRFVDATVFPEADIVEFFCQQVVIAAGLPAAHTTFWESPDGRVSAVVSERYDRRRRMDGTIQRLHQEDLCQAMSISPSKKYQRQDGGPSIGRIAKLLTTRLTPDDANTVARQFLKAVVVNAALLNTDAHAKNYSLMLKGSSVALAPMYDVSSIGAFLDSGAHPLFPMRLGATFDLEQVFPETIVAEAGRLGIARVEAADIVNHTLVRLAAVLDSTAQQLSRFDHDGIISRTVEAIRQHSSLINAVDHR